ncbi:MAG: hypothetical protein WKF58_17025 [Ilumatobacteraceae bacterium]|jgi:hypothetical protein
MGLFRRKSAWARARDAVASRADGKGIAKSGLTTAAGAVGVTAASAVVSAVRRKGAR